MSMPSGRNNHIHDIQAMVNTGNKCIEAHEKAVKCCESYLTALAPSFQYLLCRMFCDIEEWRVYIPDCIRKQ